MHRKDLITCQQAAVILGCSPATISRALAQGRLKYADPTRKLLLRQGLELRPPDLKLTARRKRNETTKQQSVLRLFLNHHHRLRSLQGIGSVWIRSCNWFWRVLLRTGHRGQILNA